jgi:transcription elongation factor GreA
VVRVRKGITPEKRGFVALEKKIMLTEEGFKKLEKELEELKTEKRKEVTEKIKLALSFGDLSENNEYDEAKNEQALIESRIAQLELMFRDVQILEKNEISTDVVSIGVCVTIEDVELGERTSYRIVSSSEVDPFNLKISDKSPIGRALLARPVGAQVLIDVPAGQRKLRIVAITK